MNTINKYNENSIKVLNSLEAIKKRPDMYIGSTNDGSGLHHLIFEVIDNSIDEFLSGFCNLINIKIYKNNYISIYDNGRGIPINIKEDDNNIPLRSAAEIVMTELHSGSKFNNKSYKISSGLHGVGLSCLNALSKRVKLIIYKNKKKYFLEFKFGILQNRKIYIKNNIKYSKVKIIGKTKKRGTKIKFLLNKKIFKNIYPSYDIIYEKLKTLSFLNKKLKINIIDFRIKKKKKIKFNNGIINYLKNININKKIIGEKIIKMKKLINSIEISIFIL